MNDILNVYKEIGETPLEALQKVRKENNIPDDVSMTYAGRLDPIAEGVLVVLVGDDVHKKDEFNALDKEYEFVVLFGVSTDSYDILGKITHVKGDPLHIEKDQLEKFAFEHTGSFEQSYPPYSSKPVNGKPLYEWARENNLDDIVIPSRKVKVAAFVVGSIENKRGETILDTIEERIEKVSGDFRQKEIIDLWKDNIQKDREYAIVRCKVVCSSGTYIRGLVHSIGKELGIPATTFQIKRTRVGKMRIT